MVPRRFGLAIVASAFDETCCRSCLIVFARRIRPRPAGMEGSVSVSPSFVTSSSCTAEPSRRTVPVWDMARRLPSACPSIAGRGLRPRRRPPRSTYRCQVDASSFAWPQVLVVEDHDDARDLVACVLDAAGAEVTTAASSREALNGIAGTMPDLLLADLGLPDEDGYTLLRRIRANTVG